MKAEIINDGERFFLIRTKRGDTEWSTRVERGTIDAKNEVMIALVEEIEELREALELDAIELESAKDLVRHAKLRTEQDLDEVLRLLEDRGKTMTKGEG